MSLDLFKHFFDLLTGKHLSLKEMNSFVHVPAKYACLFGRRNKDFDISLIELGKVVSDILSRREEYDDFQKDKFGRFDHSKSILVKNCMDRSPVLDELILSIARQLGYSQRCLWPDGKKAIVSLTHDVDAFDGTSYLWMRKLFWLAMSFQSVCRFNNNEAKSWLRKINRWHNVKKDPVFAFDRWMELEDKYGFRSTFFFMSLKNALSREGRFYSYKDPRVSKVIKELNKGGWEIGLHAAYYNHLNLNYLKEQKHRLEDILEDEILGCRHHYLRVRFPGSWLLYKRAGFKYGSNMGWDSGFDGFRAGTCFPYQPIKNSNKLELWEIPFQLMDSSTIENPESYIGLFLNYLDKVKKVNGCLVLDFHQEYFDEEEAPGVNVTYKEILNILSKDDEVLITKLKDIIKYLASLRFSEHKNQKKMKIASVVGARPQKISNG